MKCYREIIFVGETDTCRSPMAAAIMRERFLHAQVQVSSRGMVCLFPEPINQKAQAVLISNGVSCEEHSSTQLAEEDFKEDHLIIILEEEHRQKIYDTFQNVQNVYSLTELIDEEEELINPYGGPLTAYGMCYETLNRYIRKLVKVINEGE